MIFPPRARAQFHGTAFANPVYNLWLSTLGAATPVKVIGDPTRQVLHAHLSPNGQYLVATRYNNFVKGVALEGIPNYYGSEVLIMGPQGQGVCSLIPPLSGTISGNCSWLPDSSGFLYAYTAIGGQSQIWQYTLATGTSSPVTPLQSLGISAGYQVADPSYQPGSTAQMVVTVIGGSLTTAAIALYNGTTLVVKSSHPGPLPGDTDAKLSPDGLNIAFNRELSSPANSSAIIIYNIAGATETNISPTLGTTSVDGVPEWISNTQLVFWRFDAATPSNNGIYTMNIDGTNRTKISLPSAPGAGVYQAPTVSSPSNLSTTPLYYATR